MVFRRWFPRSLVVSYGMFERLFHLSDRIVVAEKYTAVIGAQLGILPKASEPLNVSELRLETLKAKSIGAKRQSKFVSFAAKRPAFHCISIVTKAKPESRSADLSKVPQLSKFL